jgi:hypothetical protein
MRSHFDNPAAADRGSWIKAPGDKKNEVDTGNRCGNRDHLYTAPPVNANEKKGCNLLDKEKLDTPSLPFYTAPSETDPRKNLTHDKSINLIFS